MHSGLLTLGGEKMSKSLGNIVTIRKVAETHDLEALRLLFIGVHYRSAVGFTLAKDDQRRAGLSRARRGRGAARLLLPDAGAARRRRPPATTRAPSCREAEKTLSGFQEAMDDDFNAAAAVGHLYEAFVLANKLLDDPKAAAKDVRRRTLARLRRDLLKCGETLGIFQREPAAFLAARRDRQCARKGIDAAAVEAKIQERAAARAAKDFTRADEIRKTLADAGHRADGRPDRHHLARGLIDPLAPRSGVGRGLGRGARPQRASAIQAACPPPTLSHAARTGEGGELAAAGGAGRRRASTRGRSACRPRAPLFTRSRSSLPTLKKARRFGRTWTASPVRGLRPWYSL